MKQVVWPKQCFPANFFFGGKIHFRKVSKKIFMGGAGSHSVPPPVFIYPQVEHVNPYEDPYANPYESCACPYETWVCPSGYPYGTPTVPIQRIVQKSGTSTPNSEKFSENPGQAPLILRNSRRAKRAEIFFRGFTICHSKSRKSVR